MTMIRTPINTAFHADLIRTLQVLGSAPPTAGVGPRPAVAAPGPALAETHVSGTGEAPRPCAFYRDGDRIGPVRVSDLSHP